MPETPERPVKFIGRSRSRMAILTLVLNMLGLSPELVALVAQVLPELQPVMETAMEALPGVLALWSAYRPDNAVTTLLPFQPGNAPLIPTTPNKLAGG